LVYNAEASKMYSKKYKVRRGCGGGLEREFVEEVNNAFSCFQPKSHMLSNYVSPVLLPKYCNVFFMIYLDIK
jgi:hypothetical protein